MRRFRLAPAPYRKAVHRALIRQYAIVGLGCAAAVVIGSAAGASMTQTASILAVAWGVGFVVTWLRLGPAIKKHLAMYEVIVSPRVVRRIMLVLPSAEMLRPEVARIVETPRALWLESRSPRRTLLLMKAIDGYADLRSEIAAWGPIESLRGWSAVAFSWGQLRHMRARDRIEAALAGDASLVEELSMVRALSADRGVGYGAALNVRRRLVRVVVVWALLVVTFIAIWQLLAPPARKPAARPPLPTASTPPI
jgi:hypothetical protein